MLWSDGLCIQDSGSEFASIFLGEKLCGERLCGIKHRQTFNPVSKVQDPQDNFQSSCDFEVRHGLRKIFLEKRNNDLSLLLGEYGNYIFHRCGV